MEACGILGRKLGHSYSPRIHAVIGNYDYLFFEREPQDVARFFEQRAFHAINVTMPYKKVAMEACDFVSEQARAIGSVNTVVKDTQGRLHGYNTDAMGMVYMLRRAEIDVTGRKCLILGSGGSSVMAQYMLREMGADSVVVISRSGENNYDNLDKHSDAEIVINATPVGMYPTTGVAAADIGRFPNCVGVADFIYNPASTKLLQDARRAGIKCTNGAPMLVAQAKYASDLFCSTQRDDGIIEPIIDMLAKQTHNIILMCNDIRLLGEVGGIVAQKSNRETIDLSFDYKNMNNVELNSQFNQSGKIILIGELNLDDIPTSDMVRQNGVVFHLRHDNNTCESADKDDYNIPFCVSALQQAEKIMYIMS